MINDVNVFSATWATGGTLKELSRPLINKVSTEALVHIATTTTIQAASSVSIFRSSQPGCGLRVDVQAVPESGITVYVDV